MPGPGSEFFLVPGPAYNFLSPGPGRDKIFLLPRPGRGRDQKILNNRGWAGTGKIKNAGAGIEIFFTAGAGPGFKFFYCRGRD